MAENKLKALVNRIAKGRPKPSAPRAGYLASGRRYGSGGNVKKKKTA